jgi:hypothetical protein
MAIACFRLVTLRPELLFKVPCFRRRIVDATFFDALFPYFAMNTLRPGRLQHPCTLRDCG